MTLFICGVWSIKPFNATLLSERSRLRPSRRNKSNDTTVSNRRRALLHWWSLSGPSMTSWEATRIWIKCRLSTLVMRKQTNSRRTILHPTNSATWALSSQIARKRRRGALKLMLKKKIRLRFGLVWWVDRKAWLLASKAYRSTFLLRVSLISLQNKTRSYCLQFPTMLKTRKLSKEELLIWSYSYRKQLECSINLNIAGNT